MRAILRSAILLLSALGLVLAGAMLSPCGCKNKAAEAPRRITFAVGGAPAELDFWQELVAEFQARSGIEVKLLRQPTDTDLRRQGLVTALKAGQADPDVFLMDVGWQAQFAASDWLEPLDNYVEKGLLQVEPFFKRVVDEADRYHGALIALPVYVDGGLLYYRKDLLAEAGFDAPPRTWPELVTMAKAVQERMHPTVPDFFGYVWQGAQYEGLVCNWLEVAASGGGGLELRDGRMVLDTPANRRATAFLRDLIHTDKVSPPNTYTEMKEEEVRTFFQNGKAMFERNWPYAWSLHQAADSPVRGKVGIAALPCWEGGRSISVLGGWHIALSRFSDAKDAAATFMQFVLSYDTQKRLALRLGWNPGRRDVYDDPDVTQALPHFHALQAIFENLKPRPTLPYYTFISEVLQQRLNAVLSGEADVDEALAAAQRDVNEIVQRYAPK
jgi:multiple sugar transport system substrate-binding protein